MKTGTHTQVPVPMTTDYKDKNMLPLKRISFLGNNE